jgi:hypothetical protein
MQEEIYQKNNNFKHDFEIINSSLPERIHPRKIKQTWSGYFRKKYMSSIILSISIIIYFYYICKK